MKKFTLLVNGEDLDTGRYRFFPYMDKLVESRQKTLIAINECKKGRINRNNLKYVYAQYCVGREDTNSSAVKSAYEASRMFRYFPIEKRKKICLDIARILKSRKKELLEILIIEGHPLKLAEWELRGMEAGACKENVEYYASALYRKFGTRGNEVLLDCRRADGVVCVCPPMNASASNSYLSILSLLAGNALIIKPPLASPVSTIFLWKEIVNEALHNNRAPAGTLNVILGNSQIIMDEWLSSPYVNDIIFFGDSRTGLDMGVKIYSAGKKPILELSGNDVQIIWKDADIGKAVKSAVDCFLGSTQICMVPKILLIHQKIYVDFVEAIRHEVEKIKIGLPSDAGTMLSPVIRQKEYFEFLEDALSKGAKLICGGKRINHKGEEDNEGMYIQPSLLQVEDDGGFTRMLCFKEEIFFPLLPMVRISGNDKNIFDRISELVDLHEYGLRISVWTQSEKYIQNFIERLNNSGLLRINLPHVGFSPYLSTHGGTRRSGGPFGGMNNLWERTSHSQGISQAIS